MPDRFRCCHSGPEPYPYSAGVIGRLPLLLALVAFSAPEKFLDQILQHCLQNVQGQRRWIPHKYGDGRKSFPKFPDEILSKIGERYRGMVVTVFLDPSGYPDRSSLDSLEEGHFGPFFSP